MAALPGVSDYLSQVPAADVGGASTGLGSILGQGAGFGGIGSVLNLGQGISNLMQGGLSNDISGASDLASIAALAIPGIGEIASPIIAALGNIIGPLVQGLPANAKPQMYANYLQQQGGLPSVLGDLINAAQNKAGSGSGVLSQQGAGAFNPNFTATLLEALTGQNLGTIDPSTGRQVFTAPASGQVKNPVSLSFLPESALMSSSPMQGLTAYGYTPQQLSTPQALKAIEQATNYGDVGTGQGLGTQKVAQYLPKVVQALQAAGITPGGGTSAAPSSLGSASDYTSQTLQADTSNNNNTGTGGDITIPLSTLLSLGSTGTSLGNLLSNLLGGSTPSSTTTPGKTTTPSTSTTTPSLSTPSGGASFRQGYNSIGFAPRGPLPSMGPTPALGGSGVSVPQMPPITPQINPSSVPGSQSLTQLLTSLLGGGSSGTSSVTPWTVAA